MKQRTYQAQPLLPRQRVPYRAILRMLRRSQDRWARLGIGPEWVRKR